ncbi:uncharacterized protein THITE_113813 [Thermothielavioides terrestris NRRL 8126]|uniref:Uncharacterized protein n=1 Tax=Thermothielavioides terrestris (strain ATCC 38088 / NRRL 8126) TaxID=578455 RepID=G2RBD8_THETT|nr:uncharacterized protein THITE_113813 [Thermothielavioides terrestris NRRL 8126]AEO69109.1 hypothetical protein THITE_113813 [Thermothielavioides terrestris NRRL 8126]
MATGRRRTLTDYNSDASPIAVTTTPPPSPPSVATPTATHTVPGARLNQPSVPANAPLAPGLDAEVCGSNGTPQAHRQSGNDNQEDIIDTVERLDIRKKEPRPSDLRAATQKSDINPLRLYLAFRGSAAMTESKKRRREMTDDDDVESGVHGIGSLEGAQSCPAPSLSAADKES